MTNMWSNDIKLLTSFDGWGEVQRQLPKDPEPLAPNPTTLNLPPYFLKPAAR